MDIRNIYDYIERLSNLLRIDSRRCGVDYNLQPIQLEALHYLSISNRYSDTPKAVTTYLGQTKGTVSQTLKVLTEKGFLSKTTDSRDKRITHLQVSSAGKKLLEASIPSPMFMAAGKQLNAVSQKRIKVALRDLLQAMQQANGSRTFGVCSSCRHNQIDGNNQTICGLTNEPLSSKEVELICLEHKDAA